MSENRRLIEATFPLNQVSLDSVHEKNVRHGHTSTLHILAGAGCPLAASRATLLPDLGDAAWRQVLTASGSGTKEATRGGILHWGTENTFVGREELA